MSITEITAESQLDQEVAYAVARTGDELWEPSEKNVYFPFRFELTSLGPILLRNSRIVIPVAKRSQVLELAHEGHPGVSVMKRRLRAKVWWPLIDRDVERFVKKCRDCLLVSQPDKTPAMTRHQFPDGPWQCLAIDLMGPLPNQEQVLVVIDYYSRFQDIQFLKTTTSTAIIRCLTELFSRLGIPKSIRSDNGRQFTSQEFKNFCGENNIRLIHTPPYWPQANGEVENMNKSILKRLKICHNNQQDYKHEIQKFIMMYNVTPHGTTGKSPSELLFNRRIRDKIPSITDIVGEEVDQEARDTDMVQKQKGKEREDSARHSKESSIKIGDSVVVQNMITPHKLTSRFRDAEYTVVQRNGNEVVLVGEGKTIRRHVSHVKQIPKAAETEVTDVLPSDTITEEGTNESSESMPHPGPSTTVQERDAQKVGPLKLKRRDGMWERVNDESDYATG